MHPIKDCGAQENIFQGLLRERAGRTQEEPELHRNAGIAYRL